MVTISEQFFQLQSKSVFWLYTTSILKSPAFLIVDSEQSEECNDFKMMCVFFRGCKVQTIFIVEKNTLIVNFNIF